MELKDPRKVTMSMNGAYHSEYGGGPTASQSAPDGTPRRLSPRELAREMRIEGIRDRAGSD